MFNLIKIYAARYWLLVFFLLITILIFILQVSFQQIIKTVSVLKAWQIILLLFLFCINASVHIFSRKYLLYVLGSDCGFKNMFYIHFATLAAHYSTPAKIGFPVTVYLLKKFEDVPYYKSSAMILIEIVVSTSLCGLIAFSSFPSLFNKSFPAIFNIILILILVGISVFILFYLMLIKVDFSARIKKYLSDTASAFKNIRKGQLFVYFLFAISLRLLGGINLLVLSVFFSENITMWQSIVATSTAFFIGTISMVPLGLGTRDVSLLFYLQYYNMNNSVAIVIITLQRIIYTGLSFLLGLIFGSVLGIKNILSMNQNGKNKPNRV